MKSFKKLKACEQTIEELKKQNSALRADQAKHHQIIENLSEVLYTLDCNGRVSYISPNLKRVAGYCPEEVIGRSYSEFIGPEDNANLGENFKRSIAGEEVITEHQYMTRNRAAVWVMTRSRPIYENDQVVGIQGTLIDISERKQAEEALRHSQKMLARTEQIARIGSWEWEIETDTVKWSEEMFRIFQLDPADGAPTWADHHKIYHAEEFKKLRQAVKSALSHGDPYELELRAIRKDGSVRHCLATGFPEKASDGQVIKLFGSLQDITERKQAEAKNIEYEKLLQSTLGAIDSFLMVVDKNHRIILSNWKDHEWVPEEERQSRPYCYSALKALESRCEGCPPLETFKDGQPRWYEDQNPIDGGYKEISVVPIFGDNGEVEYVLENVRDVTTRKQNEERLRESEFRFRSFVENANDIVYEISKEGIFKYVSPNWLDFVGEPAEEAVGKSFEPYVHPEDVHLCRNFLEKVLQTGIKHSSVEYRVKHRNGSWRWHFSHGAPMWDMEGNLTGYIGIARDITEKKQAEAALRKSEREKDLILNSTAEMIAYYDTELRIIWANRAAAESVEMQTEDLFGRYCYEIWQQRTEPCPGCPVLAAKEAREPQRAEVQTHDGRYWAIRGYPVNNDAGEVVALVEFSQEITDQKQAEETSARLQEQFHQVQKLESIGRLAGGVAHDLNNLLSPILGYGEMLLEDSPANDPRLEPLEEIVSAGKRAQALVRQLLAFSRKQPLQFQSLDINDLLKGFRKLLRRTLREDINIQIHFGESIPQVEGDVGQIEQVIMNLVVNAQDAMPGGGTLTIETAQVDLDENYAKQKNGVTAGPYVMLAISDNGTGMDEHTLNHLFEPFFTTKEQGKGTGLGMSTAYGIIKQHGGNIWAYSELGQGTTIKIYLPLPTKTREAIPHAEDRKPVSKGVETVLLAEDDQQVRHLTTAILERYGYQVIVAGNGQEALSAMKKHEGPIDLLITDVIMPDINGKELYNRLSKIYPKTRVLYMSGYTDNVIAHHGVIDPGVNFIEKPFNVKALAAKVRKVLEE